MHVLVVDDDPVVLSSCKRILESDNMDVTLASHVKAGLEALGQHDIDIILVDVKMPEEDGMSLLRRMKEMGLDIPILVMSGYPTTETVETSIAHGAYVFIPKPFTPDELLETIKYIMQGGSHGPKKDSGNR